MYHTDPEIEDLLAYVQELVLDDATQGTEIQFDIIFEPSEDEGIQVLPASLARGLNEETWFRFDTDCMEVYFKGPVWKAHFLFQRIIRGNNRDALGCSPAEHAAELRAQARWREEQERDDDLFYERLTNLIDREREIGYEAGLAAHKGRWKNWAPFKWFL